MFFNEKRLTKLKEFLINNVDNEECEEDSLRCHSNKSSKKMRLHFISFFQAIIALSLEGPLILAG